VQVLPSNGAHASRPPGGGRGLLLQPYVPTPRRSAWADKSVGEDAPHAAHQRHSQHHASSKTHHHAAEALPMSSWVHAPSSRHIPAVPASQDHHRQQQLQTKRQQAVRAVIPAPSQEAGTLEEYLAHQDYWAAPRAAAAAAAAAPLASALGQRPRTSPPAPLNPPATLGHSFAADSQHSTLEGRHDTPAGALAHGAMGPASRGGETRGVKERPERRAKTSLVQKQLALEARHAREQEEAEQRKKDALRTLLQNIKEQQKRERERTETREAQRAAERLSFNNGVAAGPRVEHRDEDATALLGTCASASSLASRSRGGARPATARAPSRSRSLSSQGRPRAQYKDRALSSSPPTKDHATRAMDSSSGAQSDGGADRNRSKGWMHKAQRPGSAPSSNNVTPTPAAARSRRARSISARSSPGQAEMDTAASGGSGQLTSSRMSRRSKSAMPSKVSSTQQEGQEARRTSRLAPQYASPQVTRPAASKRWSPPRSAPSPSPPGSAPLAHAPSHERPLSAAARVPSYNATSDRIDTRTSAASRQLPSALRQLSFAGAGPMTAGVDGEHDGMAGVEWEALLQDADRLLTAPLEPPEAALEGKPRKGSKAQPRKTALPHTLPHTPKTAQPHMPSARPTSAPSNTQRNAKSRLGSAVADKSSAGILGVRSSAEVRKFMQKKKKEREKQEREEREAQEMLRRKQQANLDKYKRFPAEQARIVQTEARHRLASRVAHEEAARAEPAAGGAAAGRSKSKLPTDKKHLISSAHDIVRVPRRLPLFCKRC